MESLYLNANLSGLIQELNKYSSEEKIMEFISNTDFILKHLDNKRPKLLEKKLINKCLKNINKFLIKSYLKKLLIQHDINNITKEDLKIKLADYLASIPVTIKIQNNIYQALLENDIENYVTEVFKKENESIDQNTVVVKK